MFSFPKCFCCPSHSNEDGDNNEEAHSVIIHSILNNQNSIETIYQNPNISESPPDPLRVIHSLQQNSIPRHAKNVTHISLNSEQLHKFKHSIQSKIEDCSGSIMTDIGRGNYEIKNKFSLIQNDSIQNKLTQLKNLLTDKQWLTLEKTACQNIITSVLNYYSPLKDNTQPIHPLIPDLTVCEYLGSIISKNIKYSIEYIETDKSLIFSCVLSTTNSSIDEIKKSEEIALEMADDKKLLGVLCNISMIIQHDGNVEYTKVDVSTYDLK